MKWNPDQTKYEIIWYTHNYDENMQIREKYPESAGYLHLINLAKIEGHNLIERIRGVQPAVPVQVFEEIVEDVDDDF